MATHMVVLTVLYPTTDEPFAYVRDTLKRPRTAISVDWIRSVIDDPSYEWDISTCRMRDDRYLIKIIKKEL
jgi:hypothetical protein